MNLIDRIKMYGIEESHEQLSNVINEGSGLYYSILDKNYVLNASIGDYSVIEEIEKTKDKYDYKVVNDNLDDCVNDIEKILCDELKKRNDTK